MKKRINKDSATHLLKPVRVAFCLLFCIVSSAISYGQDATDSAANTLVAILAQNQSMQADVELLTLDQGGVEFQQSQARLVMLKPNNFYWQLMEPYEELMVTNGKNIWIFEPDLDQLTIRVFEDDLSRTPFALLNADASTLAESFDIARTALPDENRVHYVLLPLASDSLVERLSLTFLEGSLEEMQFENSLGSKTSLYFSNMETNITIDPSIFEFKPPAGIEIIDTTQN